jgi:hypothetical protein
MKKTALIVVLLLICVLAGAYLFDMLTSKSRKAREFALEAEQLEKTLSINSSKEAKIIALTHFVNFAKKEFRLDYQSDDVPNEVYHDVVVSYVKLGNLYEEQKNPKSEKYFDAAVKLKRKFVPWIKGFKIETKDDLRLYVAELEQKTKNQTPRSQ